ncbi:MAG: Xaa-Pro aminopeptidase, partial [Pyrinomonadaceae bacterium]
MNLVRPFTVSLIFLCALGSAPLIAQRPQRIKPVKAQQIKLLSVREQMDVREQWLRTRLGSYLLPMMKRHGIDMWIVVNEEFNSDPVTEHIVPPIPMVGSRDIFVFIDQGQRIERLAMVSYNEERLNNHYRLVQSERGKLASDLKKIVDDRNPKSIALDMGGSRGQTHGLSSDSYKFLAEALGETNEKKFVSAEKLLTEFMDTRVPGELEHYRNAVRATDIITQRAFSNEVITPDK